MKDKNNLDQMDDILIRTATSLDREDLKKFEQGVIEAERSYDPTLNPGHVLYYDLDELIANADSELVLAELHNEIIACGYARIEDAKPFLSHKKHAYMGFMFVSPAHRGKGINQLIMDYLKNWAITKEVYELRLNVYYDNISAIRAYEKIGFSKHMIEMRLNTNPST